ncbi:hypothetical protein Bhyg_17846, partial [Pseudolycoriella hygida]
KQSPLGSSSDQPEPQHQGRMTKDRFDFILKLIEARVTGKTTNFTDIGKRKIVLNIEVFSDWIIIPWLGIQISAGGSVCSETCYGNDQRNQ